MSNTTDHEELIALRKENNLLKQEVKQSRRIHRLWENALLQLKKARSEQTLLERNLKLKIEELQAIKLHLEDIASTDKIIIDNLHEGVVITDEHAIIQSVNPSFCKICGYDEDELVGMPMSMHKSEVHDADYYAMFWKKLKETGTWQGEFCNTNKHGELYFLLYSISVVKDWDGSIKGYTVVALDITQRKHDEEKLRKLAIRDSLTQLSNRYHLVEQLHKTIQLAQRYQYNCAVLFMDLDGFKQVNDRHGHEAGDAVLVCIAERLRGCVRETDLVARYGGDEFVIITSRIEDRSEVTLQAERILAQIQQPIPYEQTSFTIGVSIGIAIYPEHGLNEDQLLNAADNAMYTIKGRGKNNYTLAADRVTERVMR